jgi:hypothetical protein
MEYIIYQEQLLLIHLGIYILINLSKLSIKDKNRSKHDIQLLNRKSHSGEIICSARNTIGQTSKQFTLIVFESPAPTTTTAGYENIPSKTFSFF